jgi:predicted permease
VLTLVLGIGANTAIFSAVEGILLNPLPVRAADRVAFVETWFPKTTAELNALTPGEFFDLSDRHDLFASAGAFTPSSVNVTGGGEPERVGAITTADKLFDVFAIAPYLGRAYDSTDIRANRRVVMLSYAYWMRHTGGDRKAIGTTLELNDQPFTIVGVLPPGFDYPHDVGIWTPTQLRPEACNALDRSSPASRNCKIATTAVRLRDGVTLTQAREALAAAMTEWRQRMPQYYAPQLEQALHVNSLTDVVAGDLRPILLLLLGASGFVLLIACVNVACLQLVRTTGRAREIAVRGALGATRVRVVSQVLAESVIVALIGGIAGLALGMLGVRAMQPSIELLSGAPVRFDLTVAFFAVGATLVTAIVCGVAPSFRAAAIDAGNALRGSSARNTSAGMQRSRFLRGAVIVQIASALVLAAGCVIAVRSFGRLSAIDPGFRADGLIAMRVTLPADRYSTAASRLAFGTSLLERIRAIPGIRAVSTTAAAPFNRWRGESSRRPVTPGTGIVSANSSLLPGFDMVAANYFDVLGTRVLAGRAFDESDISEFTSPDKTVSPIRTVIVDETLAKELYPDGDAVGKKIGPWPPMPTIVGIVADARERSLTTGGVGNVFYPGADFLNDRTIVVRTGLPVETVSAQLRAALRSVDPRIPIASVEAINEDIAQWLSPRRLAADVLGAFAALAMLLAMLGIYGVLSYSMQQRRKEMGIRLALGAAPGDLLRLVVGGASRLAGVGIGAGVVIFIAIGRYLQSLVYGVSARDPIALIACAAVLGGLALLAAWIPARRAAVVDPAETLRAE